MEDRPHDVMDRPRTKAWRARWVMWTAVVAVPVGLAGASCDAAACGTAVYGATDARSRIIADAERLLSRGEHRQAVAKAVEAYPTLKTIKPGTAPLADRGLRIVAMASARADGAIDGGSFKGAAPGDRAANLAWSVATLRALNARRANNPSFQTDLGEALSKLPVHRAEAAKILEDLAAKGLLTSAEGYVALARLRAEAGNAAGRNQALERCKVMTKNPKLCAAPEPRG